MVYAFSGGLDKPSADNAGIPKVIEPAGFDFRKITFARISETMRPDVGGIGEAYNSGFRVKADYLPKVVRIKDAAHIVDFDSDGALKYASPRFRDLVERLEPGVHQFEPVTFVDASGQKVADMFVFFVCQRLDTVDRAHTNMLLYDGMVWLPAKSVKRYDPSIVPPGTDLEEKPKKVFSESKVGNARIWRDKYTSDSLYISDDFVKTFCAEDLKGLAKVKQESVA